ncbi:hypothetical protein [Paenibacillus sp. FSL K6-1230]|uniref:hypothetical protein n=1 Tax=Paenibacillus sp. FSL K6-1230 TaxID=2921603 RepID=UPI0030F81600
MDKIALENEMNQVLEKFRTRTASNLTHMKLRSELCTGKTALQEDCEKLASEVFCCMNNFKDVILKYIECKG